MDRVLVRDKGGLTVGNMTRDKLRAPGRLHCVRHIGRVPFDTFRNSDAPLNPMSRAFRPAGARSRPSTGSAHALSLRAAATRWARFSPTPLELLSRSGAVLLALALLLGAGMAEAQTTQTPVCSNTPDDTVASGEMHTAERVECIEEATKNGETNTAVINLKLNGVTVVTTEDNARGVYAQNKGGSGNIDVDVTGGALTTSGANAVGIQAIHDGSGDIGIGFRSGTITTSGTNAGGIGAQHRGTGILSIDVRDSTLNAHAYGIAAWANANLRIKALNTGIVTTQDAWSGITGQVTNGATGDLTIDLDQTTITTSGVGAPGRYSLH